MHDAPPTHPCSARAPGPGSETAPSDDARPGRGDRRRALRRVGRRDRGRRARRRRLVSDRGRARDAGDADARRDVGGDAGVRVVLRPRGAGAGALGRVQRGLALLVPAGGGPRRGGDGRRADRPRLGARGGPVALGAAVHGGVHGGQPDGREELRGVRVLVRRAQGGRDRGLPGARSAGRPRRAARHPSGGADEPHRPGRLPAQRLGRRGVRGAHRGVRLRRAGGRRSRRPRPTTRRVPWAARCAARWCASSSSTSARCW